MGVLNLDMLRREKERKAYLRQYCFVGVHGGIGHGYQRIVGSGNAGFGFGFDFDCSLWSVEVFSAPIILATISAS